MRASDGGRVAGGVALDRLPPRPVSRFADMALFQRDVEDLLGKRVDFLTDGLFDKPGVSADLLAARPCESGVADAARTGSPCSNSARRSAIY